MMALWVLAGALDAHAAPEARRRVPKVSPTRFGRVFEENRAAVVRVQARPPDGPESAGFLIGALGEVLFHAAQAPRTPLRVWTADGVAHEVDLLGYYGPLALAFGRVRGLDPRSTTALRVARTPGLAAQSWVVVLRLGGSGKVEPFAGVVEAEPALAAYKAFPGLAVAPVAAPARIGSPLLSAEGELVAVAVADGARRTRALAIETLMPYLMRALEGGRTEHERR